MSGFSGTVEDSFGWYHDRHVFSTPDTGNICAEISHAGWWFHQCFHANLNGIYYKVSTVAEHTVRSSRTARRCSYVKVKHCVSPPGGALLFKSPELAWAGRHRVVLLEGLRLLLSEGGHHDDTASQLQATLLTVVMMVRL